VDSGEYIARMDCDDISLPERLAKQITFLRQNPSICGVGCRAGLIDENSMDLGIKLLLSAINKLTYC
jgi:hypothetical protein